MDTDASASENEPLATNAADPRQRRRPSQSAVAKTVAVALIAAGTALVAVAGFGALGTFSNEAPEFGPDTGARLEPSGGPGGSPGVPTGQSLDLPDWLHVQSRYQPWDRRLTQPSSAPTYSFYVYRAQNTEEYPPLNANAASLGGVLWYLHNEVVNRCDSGRGNGEFGYRRFKITRIIRYKITMKTTEPLYRKGMNFGTRVAFDSGQNTGSWYPWKDKKRSYDVYGYHVGCNYLGKGPYPLCPTKSGENYCPIAYDDAIWYSFPGPCPTEDIHHKHNQCRATQPGGWCKGRPTGTGDCTWTYEDAGEIDIDEVVGIKGRWPSHYEFCRKGCLEYVKYGGWNTRDKGRCIDWWDGKFDRAKNRERMDKVDAAFKSKYPHMPSDRELPPPRCDFDKDAFYRGI
eukprot:TRINITY_DN3563_c0_g7_i1.p1 TRINITY_DN3563_c0_g7~~TRINITY_DN3563_c0_g7_i1.p1  ORF type:complete len:430 (-),score=41.19 TRINITY_DN3563_c0_g7_i1:171-1373(-)